MQVNHAALAALLVLIGALPAGLMMRGETQAAWEGSSMPFMPFVGHATPRRAAVPTDPACADAAGCADERAWPAARVAVGERYPDAHIVTKAGRYGLVNPPAGEVYAVVGHALVRMDQDTFEVRNILRFVEGARD